MLEVCCEPIYGQFNVTSVLRVKYFTYCGTARFTHGGVGNAQFTPPTPTRRNCRVSLRRRSRCKLSRRRSAGILNSSNNRTFNKVSPRGRRDDISPRRWQFDGGKSFRRQSGHQYTYMYIKIAADLRPSADGSAVRTSLVAGDG